jgi:phenylacetate-CoA ligase
MHINCDNVYLELLGEDGKPVPVGVPGSVAVTDLTNRGMPLLRYKLGDVAVAADGVCGCGRRLPLLARVEGREADYIVASDGSVISGVSLTENFAVLIPGVVQMQIVQEKIDELVFRIVRGADFGADSVSRIASLVAQRFGANVRWQLEFVDSIPQEPSGKYRFCISRVENPFTRGCDFALR